MNKAYKKKIPPKSFFFSRDFMALINQDEATEAEPEYTLDIVQNSGSPRRSQIKSTLSKFNTIFSKYFNRYSNILQNLFMSFFDLDLDANPLAIDSFLTKQLPELIRNGLHAKHFRSFLKLIHKTPGKFVEFTESATAFYFHTLGQKYYIRILSQEEQSIFLKHCQEFQKTKTFLSILAPCDAPFTISFGEEIQTRKQIGSQFLFSLPNDSKMSTFTLQSKATHAIFLIKLQYVKLLTKGNVGKELLVKLGHSNKNTPSNSQVKAYHRSKDSHQFSFPALIRTLTHDDILLCPKCKKELSIDDIEIKQTKKKIANLKGSNGDEEIESEEENSECEEVEKVVCGDNENFDCRNEENAECGDEENAECEEENMILLEDHKQYPIEAEQLPNATQKPNPNLNEDSDSDDASAYLSTVLQNSSDEDENEDIPIEISNRSNEEESSQESDVELNETFDNSSNTPLNDATTNSFVPIQHNTSDEDVSDNHETLGPIEINEWNNGSDCEFDSEIDSPESSITDESSSEENSESSDEEHVLNSPSVHLFQPRKSTSLPWLKSQIPQFERDAGLTTQSNTTNVSDDINTFDVVQPIEYNPAAVGYTKKHAPGMPTTFDELSEYEFPNKKLVIFAMTNISVLSSEYIRIRSSNKNNIVFDCSAGCSFLIEWAKMPNGTWKMTQNHPHNCPDKKGTTNNRKSNTISFLTEYIDEAIMETGHPYSQTKKIIEAVKDKIGDLPNRRIKRRIIALNGHSTEKEFKLSKWKLFKEYLDNTKANGGAFATKYDDETHKLIAIAAVPQYAALLLTSNEPPAMIPAIFIDATFQCASAKGVLVIVSTISGNNTIIPLGWAWGKSENKETIACVLQLIAHFNKDIQTVVSDGGKALASVIKEVFPNANHKLCAWHLSHKFKSEKARKLFWQMIHANNIESLQQHILEFMNLFGEQYKQFIQGKEDRLFNILSQTLTAGMSSSSISESINSAIAIHKNSEPIILFHFLEEFGYAACLRLILHQKEMTPHFEKQRRKLIQESNRYRATSFVRNDVYQVNCKDLKNHGLTWTVNIVDNHCSCGGLEITGIPCAHYIAASGISNWTKLVHPFYYTQVYRKALKDMNRPVEINAFEENSSIQPPDPSSYSIVTKRKISGFEKSKKKH